jgi:peptidoglycan/xylan/chitin deacetylase (PgdA/CDA1 family)
MNAALRGLASLAAIALLGFVAYKLDRRLTAPPAPALVTRTADAHRAVSTALDARVERLLHDRAPSDARSGNRRLVALTFDDGPYPVETPLLLDVLHDLKVRATFFVVGDHVLQFPDLARRMLRDGHEVANHTMTHPPHFEDLSAAGVTRELEDGAATIERYADDPAVRTMMRPPHGRYTEQTVRAAQRAGYHVVLWNDDPGDWRAVKPEVLAAHIVKNASAPDIVLLHSGRLATILMLPEVVERFRKAGFEFVTVGELMRRLPVSAIDHPTGSSV